MLYNIRKKTKTKEIIKLIKNYNNGTSTDLQEVGDYIFYYSKFLNKKIIATEKRIKFNILLSTSLKYNKLILTEFELESRIYQAQFLHNQENIDLYTKIKKEVNDKFFNALKENKELLADKKRYHAVLWLYSNAQKYQISKSPDSEYDNYKFTELLEMLGGDRFYKLNENQMMSLFQAIANKYCATQNIPKIPLIFATDKDTIALGSYSRFGNYIYINNDYVKIFNKLKANNSTNKYLQYRMLQTVIHECRHSMQAVGTPYNRRSKYISNCYRINTHYLQRLYFPKHNYEEGLGAYGYLSRVIEMDAHDESIKFMLDVSKLKLSNAKELEKFALYVIPPKYENKNSVIKEMIELVSNQGLPPGLSKAIYENMQILGLTTNHNKVMSNDKTDYEKTNENNVQWLNQTRLKIALDREKRYREEFFPTLFTPEDVIHPYAEKEGMPTSTFINQLKSDFENEKSEFQNTSESVGSFMQ